MSTASTLLHSIALSACLAIQAMPGAAERPAGIRRALQTMDKPAAMSLTTPLTAPWVAVSA
ncbi:hypothetical protein [Nitratireductor soli]|uniref:hypothetical protein n=1 Tax=Nitratireductor soli TaxID=1670619 RepID=UPI00065E7BF2|nr:hypothetical protein [Nitratireductor soli]